MAKDKAHKNAGKSDGRVGGGFCAIPWQVLDLQAYLSLPHPVKALLLEFARQHYFDKKEGVQLILIRI